MRHPDTDRVRSMMAPANPAPGRAAEADWAETLGQEIYQQILAQPRNYAARYEPSPEPASGSLGLPAAPRSGTALRRWLAPAAAVIAVLAVVAGLSVAARTGTGRPAAGAGAAAGRPRFYVTISDYDSRQVAQVHDSRTGKTLSWVRLPGSGILGVQPAGSPDGRDFLINERAPLRQDEEGNRVYRLRVSADGRSARLTPLSITPGRGFSGAVVTGLAVSPDGARLAATILMPGNGFNGSGEIEIISLRDGVTRTWAARGFGQPSDPSWSADGRRLSFLWWDHITGAQGVYTSWDSQVRVLDATGPGGDLLASPVIASGGGQLGLLMSAITAPDGKVIIVAAARNVPGPGRGGTAQLRLVALAPGTGRVIAVYLARQIRYRGPVQQFEADGICAAFDVNATGRQSLVSCTRFGRLDNGKFTALRGPSAYGSGTAAW